MKVGGNLDSKGYGIATPLGSDLRFVTARSYLLLVIVIVIVIVEVSYVITTQTLKCCDIIKVPIKSRDVKKP